LRIYYQRQNAASVAVAVVVAVVPAASVAAVEVGPYDVVPAADGAAVVLDDVVAVAVAVAIVVADILAVAAAAADIGAAVVVEDVHPGPGQPTLAPFARLHHDVCVLQRLAVLPLACAVPPLAFAVAKLLVAGHIAFAPLGLLVGVGVVPLRQPCAVLLPRTLFDADPLR